MTAAISRYHHRNATIHVEASPPRFLSASRTNFRWKPRRLI
jgi:hypothetical protein